ncbi:MAG: NAD-glutamate dehydrogenase [Trueperaceae bacterium]|nr:NAD-glutamate dehydrogenase [Trueperaceae bacterium]
MPTTLNQLHQYIKQRQTDARAELLHPFVDALFEKASPEFLDEFDAESLLALAVRSLEALQDKDPDDIHVRVYNPSYDADGWEAPYTVLELSLIDCPFVVDSVQAELRRRGYALYYMLHPIIGAERDDDHTLTRILPRGQATQEAFELYFVRRENDPEKQRALQQSVREVLRDVRLATGAYAEMCDKAAAVAESLEQVRDRSAQGYFRERGPELEEYAKFLRWLVDDNFVFLGYREYDIKELGGVPHLQVTPDSGVGILSKIEESGYREPVPLEEIPQGLRERVTGGKVLIVTKTNAESTVHRPARMDYVGVKKLSDSWQVRGERRFVGLFTSKALSTPIEETPILRRKLEQVLERDDAAPGSHDAKEIVSIFNSMPRTELFWSDTARLHKDIRTVMGMAHEHGVRLTLRPDPLSRGVAVMVIMPRERFNARVREKIQQLLTERLEASHVDYQLAMGEDEAQVRFHFFFTTEMSHFDVNLPALENDVAELTRTWDDHLRERLADSYGEMDGRQLAERYLSAFDERYKADMPSLAALRDIENIEKLGTDPYLVDVVNPLEDDATHLKIYHLRDSLVLSDVMPILENLGCRVLEQISYVARLEGGSRGIDIFRVQNTDQQPLDVREDGARLIEALRDLLAGEAENDRLNGLVLYGNLSIRDVALLRAYQMYYAQLSAVTSRRFINDTLLRHPHIAALLYRSFRARFEPGLTDREESFEQLKSDFLDSLNDVASLPEDRTLRELFGLVEATVRTNFFRDKRFISYKVDSAKVASMPEPRPMFDIIVASPDVEAIHLRGGKVARGGIRWSDRPDDFRTEVLGLMKTQMTKNAVIVPVGSKGGFIVKNAPAGRDALKDYVRAQYQTFMRGMLELTDNMVGGEVAPPDDLVSYDEPDPYLVVAADKGTATFSDLANETAAEYDFWLGDAFASGGSYGYDHKEEGITARGAWECVERHFRELGRDVHNEPVSVVGIGDMSGDVFGNGMVHTDTLEVIAAFNHLHIFLDPNPDPAASYQERKRLFELPRSSWEDYDTSLISEGGGVYSRYAKSITLTPQVRDALGTDAEALSGQALIQAILKAPVDLLWNGGIGTYVKSSHERHAEVGDSSNDTVRIDADDLRAKVVGEGGNLGFTQLARIEFARAGGKINTDAIDNSGGVDMSDREVNIKILLQPLVRSGEFSFVQRNRLLEEMTDDVSNLVLGDNYRQSLSLSLAERRSQDDLGLFEALQLELTEQGGLNPQVEFLPGAKAFEERHRAGEALTRPELAILLAYSKMVAYGRLLDTDLPDEPFFQHYLFDYFPQALRDRVPEAIREHSLRREITATQFTNTVTDLMGLTFIYRNVRDTGATRTEVLRAALVAFEVLEVSALTERIYALDGVVSAQTQYEALAELVLTTESVVQWMLLSGDSVGDVKAYTEVYQQPLTTLRQSLSERLPERELERFEERRAAFAAQGVPHDLAGEIVSLDYLPSGMGVIDVSRSAEVSLDVAAEAFYALGDRLALGWLRDNVLGLASETRWEKISQGGLVMDLRQVQRRLTSRYLSARRDEEGLELSTFLSRHGRLLERYDQDLQVIRADDLTLASANVLARVLLQMAETKVPQGLAVAAD